MDSADYKSAMDLLETFKTVKPMKEYLETIGREYGFIGKGTLFDCWKERCHCHFYISDKETAPRFAVMYHSGSSDSRSIRFSNWMYKNTAEKVSETMNLLSSLYVDASKMFDMTLDLYNTLKTATFETCHTCDEIEGKVPSVLSMTLKCSKEGDHCGCFVKGWRDILSKSFHTFENDLRFLVVKSSDIPAKVVIDADTVAKFGTLEDAKRFVEAESTNLESYFLSRKYPMVAKEVVDDGRLTVVSRFNGNIIPRLNTVWKIVELPPRA